MSAHEDALRTFLAQAQIVARAGADVPTLIDPDTGRDNHADFFVPETNLHIEVKGQMTFDAIRKVAALTQATPAYYLYQHRDWDWHPEVTDWPRGVLRPADVAALEKRVTAAGLLHRASHPPRRTRAKRYQGAHVAQARALQQAEILLMARNPAAAARASLVTTLRLKRYLARFMTHLGW
jgi:hypothetical protein